MTPQVRIAALSKRFGDVVAVDRVDLDVARGHVVALLGPSGCGKTTLLRLVAGFERPDAGTIHLAGREVTGSRVVPVHRRGVAVVPQEGALFPHLRVGENVAFGLGRDGDARRRVGEVLDLVGLGGLERRYPHELSGGQQQRVAVARALAPRPALVLLDEPFSALDAALRVDLRVDVRAALAEDGATAVLVTHDQAEALSVADEVAVMRAGRIVQCATPEDVYHRPVDAGVATFVGEATLLPGRVADGTARTVLGSSPVAAGAPSGEVVVLLRPEQIVLTDGGVPGVVAATTYHGHDSLLRVRLDSGEIVMARVLSGTWTAPGVPGDQVRVGVTGRVHVLPTSDATPA